MSTKQVDKMVDRFLGWKLPDDFTPDAGISFIKPSHPNHPWPTGTNLFDAGQAKQMIEFLWDSEIPVTENIAVDNLVKLILKANLKEIREVLMPDELDYFNKTYGI